MSAEYFIRRQDKLRTLLAEKKVDGMLITNRYILNICADSVDLVVLY